MKTYESLEELKANSVLVLAGMISVYPQFHLQEEIYIDVDETPKFNGCYATNNSTVAFVTDGLLYATPYTRSVIRCLHANGFKKRTFYVPFSNWDYPLEQAKKWSHLRAQAEQEAKENFTEDCIKWSEEHGFDEISQSVLDKCFLMPNEGVRVKHFYFEDTYYPLVTGYVLDCIATDRIGSYCCNNGRVVFVYRDGRTYVTKGYKILRTLRAAGYVEKGLFVPFSNGEIILDPVQAARWDEVCGK